MLLSKVADVKLTNRFLWLEQGEAESETNAKIPKFILKLKQSCAPVRCLPPSPTETGPTALSEEEHLSHSWECDPMEMPRSVARGYDCALLPVTIRPADSWNHLAVAVRVRRFFKIMLIALMLTTVITQQFLWEPVAGVFDGLNNFPRDCCEC